MGITEELGLKDYDDAMVKAGKKNGLLSGDIEDMNRAVGKYGWSIVTKVMDTTDMQYYREQMFITKLHAEQTKNKALTEELNRIKKALTLLASFA